MCKKYNTRLGWQDVSQGIYIYRCFGVGCAITTNLFVRRDKLMNRCFMSEVSYAEDSMAAVSTKNHSYTLINQANTY